MRIKWREETGVSSFVNAIKGKSGKKQHSTSNGEFAVDLSSETPEGGTMPNKTKVAKSRQTQEDNNPYELYFAYGSCMSEDFARSVPDYVCLGHAVLKNYRLAFTRYSSSRGGGVADIVPAMGSTVEGVLYQLHREMLPDLDVREGVKSGAYQRISVKVETVLGPREAWTYEVVEKEQEELPPTNEYADLILSGARPVVSRTYFQHLKAHIDKLQSDDVDYC